MTVLLAFSSTSVVAAATAAAVADNPWLNLVTVSLALVTTVVALIVKREVQKVHILVNNRLTEVLVTLGKRDQRVGQLIQALEGSDTAVPPQQEGNPK